MSITGIIMAAVIVGGTGLFIGIFLGLADKKLTVKVDEKEEAILGVLPGNNCGGCGYPGCSGLAAAIAKGDTGVEDCEMMAFIPGSGAKNCTFGCMGFGSCVKACPFDAIHIVNGIAVVDQEACKACGKCVAKCPRHLIELVPYDKQTRVACSSHAKGKAVTTACELGCIGCKNKKDCLSRKFSE